MMIDSRRHLRTTFARGLAAAILAVGFSRDVQSAGTKETASNAPVLSQVKIIESKSAGAEVYGSFEVSDPDRDFDPRGQNAITVVIFCTEGNGFWLDANAKCEKVDDASHLVYFRVRSEHTGTGECDFTLKVSDKAGNVGRHEMKVTFPK
jgi:hypothetical protein